MQVAQPADLKGIVLDGSVFGPQEIQQITSAISADFSNYRVLREAVQELETREATPASKVRLGVCYYLLGRYRQAADTLSTADGGALAQFYLGRTRAAQGQYNEANEAFQKAAKGGYDTGLATLAKVDCLRQAGRNQEALATLDSLSGAIEQTAEYLYQRGATVAAVGGNPHEVVALYERAVEADPTHAGALFGLALENDRRGNDDEALKLYERSASRFPSHIGALLNLGVLYEDSQRFDRAVQCYQRILEAHPNEPRARLYFKDARASGDMFYDEDAQKRRDRLSQVLGVPVTDFELSVRSRNCLQKMGLLSLGDLARTTELQAHLVRVRQALAELA